MFIGGKNFLVRFFVCFLLFHSQRGIVHPMPNGSQALKFLLANLLLMAAAYICGLNKSLFGIAPFNICNGVSP